jgi:hypothetical protein
MEMLSTNMYLYMFSLDHFVILLISLIVKFSTSAAFAAFTAILKNKNQKLCWYQEDEKKGKQSIYV